MDWAGTAVDYGCFAPVAAFLKAFAEKGLTVTMEEARGPMGMTKIDHIRELFKLPSVTEQFKQNYNRNWTEEDVVSIYKEFEKHLFASLEEYTTPIPGVIEVIEKLKRDGIKIGSTTGYTTAMMDIVLPGAAAHGYTTDNCVTSNNLPAGRPKRLLRLSGIVWTMARTRRKQKAESISPLMNVIRPPWRTSSFWQRPAMPL